MNKIVKDYLTALTDAGVFVRHPVAEEIEETEPDYACYDNILASMAFNIDWVGCGASDFTFNVIAFDAIRFLKENGRNDVASLLANLNHVVVKLADADSVFHMNVMYASFNWLRWFAAGNIGILPSIWSMV